MDTHTPKQQYWKYTHIHSAHKMHTHIHPTHNIHLLNIHQHTNYTHSCTQTAKWDFRHRVNAREFPGCWCSLLHYCREVFKSPTVQKRKRTRAEEKEKENNYNDGKVYMLEKL